MGVNCLKCGGSLSLFDAVSAAYHGKAGYLCSACLEAIQQKRREKRRAGRY